MRPQSHHYAVALKIGLAHVREQDFCGWTTLNPGRIGAKPCRTAQAARTVLKSEYREVVYRPRKIPL
jgi:hypothetical protein